MREGISAPLPELAQQLVAREMLQILSKVAGSAPPTAGFPPLFNEHQIQARGGVGVRVGGGVLVDAVHCGVSTVLLQRARATGEGGGGSWFDAVFRVVFRVFVLVCALCPWLVIVSLRVCTCLRVFRVYMGGR